MTNQSNALATRQPNALEAFKQFIRREDVMTRFEEILGSHDARPFVNNVIVAVANSPKLQECTIASIITAASRAAMLRLSVNDNTGQAWIIPYGKVARFQPGWKGLRDMAMEGGKVRYLNVGELYEGEYIEIDRLTGSAEFKGGRISNKIYALFVFYQDIYGFKKTIVRTLEEIHTHAKLYNPGGYASKDGPWQSDKPRTVRGMEKKTILTEMINAWIPLDPYKKKILNTYEQMPAEDLGIVEAQFTPEPLPVKTEWALMGELGYDESEQHEPNVSRETSPAPVVTETYPMSPDMAFGEKDSNGKLYAEYTTEQLAKHSEGIAIAIGKEKDPEKITALQFKQAAIGTILQYRANHPEA